MKKKLTLKDLHPSNLKEFKEKLQSRKYSLMLGSYAYTPMNKQLTKWMSSDGGTLNCGLQELIDDYASSWLHEEIYYMIDNEEWDKLFAKANIRQQDYEEFFIKNMSILDLSSLAKKLAGKKYSATYILETRKKLNKVRDLLTTISEMLEDIPQEVVEKLNKQLDHVMEYLKKVRI